MFEETLVCMTCGRPVEGQVYCSDECESLDIQSESLSSGVSSAYPSPYLHPMNAAGNIDVPALVHSRPRHRTRHSVSSSSNSSVLTDEEDGDPYIYSSEDFGLEVEGMTTKSPGSHNGLFYVRKPSSTNHRAIVPTVHKHSSSSSSSFGQKGGFPSPYYAATEDDSSDVQSLSLSDAHQEESERSSTLSAAAAKRRRNRASLPAYFSLLQTSNTPSSSMSARRSSASILTLNALSRSLHSSPTTPKITHPPVGLASPEVHVDPTPRGRGRRREREPDVRSASGRRATARSPPRHMSRPGLTFAQRARIDSFEKVAEWVSSSPLIGIPGQRAHTRRNSSPAPKPKRESLADALERALEACVIADEEDDQERTIERSERRGRRRVGELDEPMTENAPGLGSGRSGLRARERERERGRPIRPVGL